MIAHHLYMQILNEEVASLLLEVVPHQLRDSVGQELSRFDLSICASGLFEKDDPGYKPPRSIKDHWPTHYPSITATEFGHDSLMVMGELVKNAARHGNGWDRTKSTEVAALFGTAGFIIGVRDEGDFYRQPKTKRLLETRQPIPSTSTPPSGLGTSCYLAEVPSRVFIDTTENICMVSLSTSYNGAVAPGA